MTVSQMNRFESGCVLQVLDRRIGSALNVSSSIGIRSDMTFRFPEVAMSHTAENTSPCRMTERDALALVRASRMNALDVGH